MDKTYDFSDTKLYEDIEQWEKDHRLNINLNSMFEGRGDVKTYEIDKKIYVSFSSYFFLDKEIEIINTVDTHDYTLSEKRIHREIKSAYYDCQDIAIDKLCKSRYFVDGKKLRKDTISLANESMIYHLKRALTGSGNRPLIIF